MTRILAIESDPQRGAAMQRLLLERLSATVVVAASTEEAIISMAEDTPNLILTSSLITPDEERRLSAHLRRVPHLRHLPVLTVPPLVEAAIAVDKKRFNRFSLWSLFMRRRRRPKPQTTWPAYNADAVAARVHEALEESRMAQAMRVEADDSAMQALLLEIDQPPRLLEAAPSSVLQMPEEELREYCRGPMKDRAPRWTRGDLPWLSTVKLTWGLELRLVNISRSGLLVESNVRLTPGNKTDFQLAGADRDLIVAARVIRSHAATGDNSNVIYQTAAEFEQACDWLMPEVSAPGADVTLYSYDELTELAAPAAGVTLHSHDEVSALAAPATGAALHPHDELGALVARVTHGARLGEHSVDLRNSFEAGVRALVNARHVRLVEGPVTQYNSRDTVSFEVPTHDGSPAALLVTFDPAYRPRAKDYEASRQAAAAAADVLRVMESAREANLETWVPTSSGGNGLIYVGAA